MRCGAAALVVALAAAGCEPSENDPGPGGVTVGEARALDEAAEMIEQQRFPEEVLPPASENDEGATGEADAAPAGEPSAGPAPQ